MRQGEIESRYACCLGLTRRALDQHRETASRKSSTADNALVLGKGRMENEEQRAFRGELVKASPPRGPCSGGVCQGVEEGLTDKGGRAGGTGEDPGT